MGTYISHHSTISASTLMASWDEQTILARFQGSKKFVKENIFRPDTLQQITDSDLLAAQGAFERLLSDSDEKITATALEKFPWTRDLHGPYVQDFHVGQPNFLPNLTPKDIVFFFSRSDDAGAVLNDLIVKKILTLHRILDGLFGIGVVECRQRVFNSVLGFSSMTVNNKEQFISALTVLCNDTVLNPSEYNDILRQLGFLFSDDTRTWNFDELRFDTDIRRKICHTASTTCIQQRFRTQSRALYKEASGAKAQLARPLHSDDTENEYKEKVSRFRQLLHQNERKRIKIKDCDNGTGLGAFALVEFSARDVVCEYVGEIISKDLQNKIEQANQTQAMYFMQMSPEDDNNVIDSSVFGNIGRYLNHSCDPNCCVVFDDVLRSNIFLTRCKIKEKEELTFDYYPETRMWDVAKFHYARHQDRLFTTLFHEECSDWSRVVSAFKTRYWTRPGIDRIPTQDALDELAWIYRKRRFAVAFAADKGARCAEIYSAAFVLQIVLGMQSRGYVKPYYEVLEPCLCGHRCCSGFMNLSRDDVEELNNYKSFPTTLEQNTAEQYYKSALRDHRPIHYASKEQDKLASSLWQSKSALQQHICRLCLT